MQELKIKGTEIIKINGELFLVKKGLDTTNIKKLDKDDEKAICHQILDTLYIKDLKFVRETSVKLNNEGLPCMHVYDQSNLVADKAYKLDYFRAIKNIQNYGLTDETKTYFVYVDYVKDVYELFTCEGSDIKEIRDIKQDIIEGKICPIKEGEK